MAPHRGAESVPSKKARCELSPGCQRSTWFLFALSSLDRQRTCGSSPHQDQLYQRSMPLYGIRSSLQRTKRSRKCDRITYYCLLPKVMNGRQHRFTGRQKKCAIYCTYSRFSVYITNKYFKSRGSWNLLSHTKSVAVGVIPACAAVRSRPSRWTAGLQR